MKDRIPMLALLALTYGTACRSAPTAMRSPRETVRCAVIGGMVSTGFFQAVARRFEEATGTRVEIVVSGNKEAIAPAMERGEVDLITMHASDTIANLVADGYAVDAQPWAKNELVIIGPPEDPAGVHGLSDAAEAMRRIVAAKAPFVVPHSMGAHEVLRAVLHAARVSLDETTAPHGPDGPDVTAFAAARHAYTIVGRIPFMQGKIPSAGLVIAVQGDPRLRRPYLVAVANPKRFPAARVEAARALARFLRAPETQQWIAAFVGSMQDAPPFFPIAE
jgi:tungstate transport system substrate-binding protein